MGVLRAKFINVNSLTMKNLTFRPSSSFGIQLSIHWMITSCCACVGIRNNNKFSQFITYLQVPIETNFVVKTIYNFIFI